MRTESTGGVSRSPLPCFSLLLVLSLFVVVAAISYASLIQAVASALANAHVGRDSALQWDVMADVR